MLSIEKEKNKGFTLIELIIAIAMLAFLMTAVSSFMASGMMSYKKAKADIRVHNSAQENYDKISDAIMEAKDIYLFGYLDGSNELRCFVRDEKQADNISTVVDQVGIGALTTGTSVTSEYFESFNKDTNICIAAIVIDTAVPIMEADLSSLTKAGEGLDTYKNYLVTNGEQEIKQATKVITVDSDGNPKDTAPVTDDDGNPVYTVNDTIRHMFVFDEENMYYMVKYAFQNAKSDNYVDAGTGAKLSDYLYSSSFDINDDNRTNCIAHVDAENGAISIDLMYSDKNMTYTTEGLIRTRNSYVLRAKK